MDLIYLDPPFNSNQNYNVLFAEKSGEASAAQIHAFEDTWHWDQASARAHPGTKPKDRGQRDPLITYIVAHA